MSPVRNAKQWLEPSHHLFKAMGAVRLKMPYCHLLLFFQCELIRNCSSLRQRRCTLFLHLFPRSHMGKKKHVSHSPSLFDNEDVAPVSEAAAMDAEPPQFPLPDDLDSGWLKALALETQQPYWAELQRFVADERKHHTVYPPAEDVFNAFRYTPL